MTVAELLSRISSHEVTEWQIYEKLFGPLGARRGDYHAAQIAAAIANANRSKKSKVAKLVDHLLSWGFKRPRPEMSAEDMVAALRSAPGIGGVWTVGDDS